MLTLISPAKSLTLDRVVPTPRATQPKFLDRAAPLVEILRGYSPNRLEKLLGISRELAELNAERYARWERPFTSRNSLKAVLTFDGDVYRGLDAEHLEREDFAFAQDHLRILSGLYGLLRPLDLIQPYRLEMGTKLRVGRDPDLYRYWSKAVTGAIGKELAKHETPVLVNLASAEYFKVVDPPCLEVPIVTPVFKEYRNGRYTMLSFPAKRARGRMARFIIEKRIDEPELLKGFDVDHYRFVPSLSNEREWLFGRRS